MHRAAPIAALLLFSVSSAAADTIVLKNGRRITAANVTDDGEHVSYETSAGRFTLPKSIIARVEKDQFGYSSSSSSHQNDPPPVSAPEIAPVRGYDDIVRLAVHDDSIDFAYIARLEADARSGSPAAIEKVSAAHYTAAQFLLSKGEVDGAIDHYRQALNFAPENLGLLLNLSVLLLRQSQFTSALDPLDHARRVAPNSADVAKLTGWAYYGLNKMDLAVEEWQRAEHLHPDPEVERALAKAQKDKAEEESYREGVTAHFALKYSGTATPDLASGILHALEDDFNDIESQLDYTPPEPIGVILYTGQAFADITRAPSWAGAINDGRIRIPVQGLSSVTSELARVLKHELTHSFIGQKTRGRAPTWVQEGVAQWMEGRRSNSAAGALVELAGQGRAPSLQMLEGSWMSLSGGAASFAYAYALAAVESIIESGGIGDISRLLDRISTAPSMDAALRDALHADYSDLDQQTIAYLRHEYLR
jgi:predicted negative regulator of RcsB-dependent stress response